MVLIVASKCATTLVDPIDVLVIMVINSILMVTHAEVRSSYAFEFSFNNTVTIINIQTLMNVLEVLMDVLITAQTLMEATVAPVDLVIVYQVMATDVMVRVVLK